MRARQDCTGMRTSYLDVYPTARRRFCTTGAAARPNVAAHPHHSLLTIAPLLPLSSTIEPTDSTSGRCALCVELRLAMLQEAPRPAAWAYILCFVSGEVWWPRPGF